jgi:probable F420-dependent oxidoreductase
MSGREREDTRALWNRVEDDWQIQVGDDGDGNHLLNSDGRLSCLHAREENTTMQIGISLLNNWGIEDVQSIVQLATRAEALGFASVWVHDHVFNAGHVFRRIGHKPYYEPLTLLSYVAARTERVGLGTSVLVLPYHNPIRLAKTAATLDVLSGGRLILGVGVGAVPPESEAMGSPYAERGAMTDEAIAVMKELWTQDDPRFAGKYSRFSGMPFSPKPLQWPHIPLLIGGNSRAAIRRAVRLGNGWHPLAVSPERLAQAIGDLHEQAQAAGRAIAEIPVSLSIPMGPSSAQRAALGTAPGEIIRTIQAYADLGVQMLAISGQTGLMAEMLPAMDLLAREVLPAFR